MILRTRPSSISRARPDMTDARIVGRDDKIAGALLDQPVDQRVRLADGAESADQHGGTVLDARHGVGHRLDDLVDHAWCFLRDTAAAYHGPQGDRKSSGPLSNAVEVRMLRVPIVCLFVLIYPAFAADTEFCRNGVFPQQATTFGLAKVIGGPRIYLRSDIPPCPDDSAACRGRAYVLPRDTVITGVASGPYVCALFAESRVPVSAGTCGGTRSPRGRYQLKPHRSRHGWAPIWRDRDSHHRAERPWREATADGKAYWPWRIRLHRSTARPQPR